MRRHSLFILSYASLTLLLLCCQVSSTTTEAASTATEKTIIDIEDNSTTATYETASPTATENVATGTTDGTIIAIEDNSTTATTSPTTTEEVATGATYETPATTADGTTATTTEQTSLTTVATDSASTTVAATTPTPTHSTSERPTEPTTTESSDNTVATDSASTTVAATTPTPTHSTSERPTEPTTTESSDNTDQISITSSFTLTTTDRMTTRATPTTTTPDGARPPNYDAITYSLTSAIGFEDAGARFGDIMNTSSALYKECMGEATVVIINAYFGCPGFDTSRVTAIGLENVTVATAVSNAITSFKATVSRLVVVKYSIFFYDDFKTSTSTKEITTFIEGTALQRFNESVILGVPLSYDFVNDSIQNTLTTQGEILNKDACYFSNVCDDCFNCTIPSNSPNALCTPLCTGNNRYCQILETMTGTDTACSCAPYYLPVAGDCVHQNWVIGLSAGIGGALVVGLVIAVIVLSCNKSSSSSRGSTSSKDRLYQSEATSPMAFSNDDINLAEIGGTGTDQHSTFGRTEADASTRDADKDDTAVSPEQQRQNEELAAQAAEQRQLIEKQEQQLQEFANQLQRQQEQMQQMQQEQQEQLQQLHQQQAAAAAPPSTQPSSAVQQTTVPDYSYGGQPTAQQSPPYSTSFVPQLQNVDPYTNYAIRRPQTVAPPTAPRPYPTTAYSPDFF